MTAVVAALIVITAPAALAQAPSPFGAVPSAPDDSFQFGAPLPDFEVKDITGRTWRLDDLRGKFTLIYIWHTFEARATDAHDRRLHELVRGLPDLPQLQRFYDKARLGDTLQVLAFCIDYDYTHAPEYMKQANYTFPVIADWQLIRKLFGDTGTASRYRVVDPEGRLSRPFRSWSFGRVLMELEAAAAKQ